MNSSNLENSGPSEKPSHEQLENANKSPTRHVDEKEEKRLMRKLDRRIVPMMVWMYLMSFMDRGMVVVGWWLFTNTTSLYRQCKTLRDGG
jgi:aromatic ring-cleaving dioxygenase